MNKWIVFDESPDFRKDLYSYLYGKKELIFFDSAQKLVNELTTLKKDGSLNDYGMIISSYFTFDKDYGSIDIHGEWNEGNYSQFKHEGRPEDVFRLYETLVFNNGGLWIPPPPTIFINHPDTSSIYDKYSQGFRYRWANLAGSNDASQAKLTSVDEVHAPKPTLFDLLSRW